MYLNEEREKILKMAKDERNSLIPINLSLGYSLYDLLRVELEELHRIGDAVESIRNAIQQEEQNL